MDDMWCRRWYDLLLQFSKRDFRANLAGYLFYLINAINEIHFTLSRFVSSFILKEKMCLCDLISRQNMQSFNEMGKNIYIF